MGLEPYSSAHMFVQKQGTDLLHAIAIEDTGTITAICKTGASVHFATKS